MTQAIYTIANRAAEVPEIVATEAEGPSYIEAWEASSIEGWEGSSIEASEASSFVVGVEDSKKCSKADTSFTAVVDCWTQEPFSFFYYYLTMFATQELSFSSVS